jgi:hypothetical protein
MCLEAAHSYVLRASTMTANLTAKPAIDSNFGRTVAHDQPARQARSVRERTPADTRGRASSSPREIGGIYFVNQDGRLIARVLSSRRFFYLTAEMTAKVECPYNLTNSTLCIPLHLVQAYLFSIRQAVDRCATESGTCYESS